MNCRQCGTEIAEKALICFKCGAATTDPVYQPPAVAAALPQWAHRHLRGASCCSRSSRSCSPARRRAARRRPSPTLSPPSRSSSSRFARTRGGGERLIAVASPCLALDCAGRLSSGTSSSIRSIIDAGRHYVESRTRRRGATGRTRRSRTPCVRRESRALWLATGSAGVILVVGFVALRRVNRSTRRRADL